MYDLVQLVWEIPPSEGLQRNIVHTGMSVQCFSLDTCGCYRIQYPITVQRKRYLSTEGFLAWWMKNWIVMSKEVQSD
jgi:hypothetical protein